ncbi:MAG: OmpH family outer membrane protein [Allomuricauda sp.]
MKKIMVLAVALIAMACQQNKIGYVDSVKLLDGYQEKIDVEARFKTKADAMTKKRDSISQAFQMELQAFQTKAERMSQQNAQEEYGQLQQRGQFIGQQLQQEEQQLQQTSQTEMDSLVKKVKKEIQAYGKSNGYTYILGGGDGGAVLYGDEAKDLTDVILKILNDKYDK